MTPGEDRAKQRYQGAAGQRYHHHKRSIPERAFPWVARLRAAKIAPHVRSTDTVLEYGVGYGWNLMALECARKIGLDVSELLEPLVRQHGIEFISDPNAIPEGAIDVVVCHHMLEHAWHPAETLAAIRRLLHPDGRLLLFVPYEKERRFRRFNPAEPNHHLYSWNVQTLSNLVQETGFRVQSAGIFPFGQERFAARLATKLHLCELGFRTLRWLANTVKHEFEVRVFGVKQA